MVQIDIPFTQNDLDTDDPSGSAINFIATVGGFVALFGATAGASYVYSRMKAGLGVDAEANIPGV